MRMAEGWHRQNAHQAPARLFSHLCLETVAKWRSAPISIHDFPVSRAARNFRIGLQENKTNAVHPADGDHRHCLHCFRRNQKETSMFAPRSRNRCIR